MNDRVRRLVFCVLATSSLSGCRSIPGDGRVPSDEAPQTYTVVLGSVRQVRTSMGYVVLECVGLPLPGEQATVYRGDEVVGYVCVTKPIRMPYAAADIVGGSPAVGDKAKVVRIRAASPRERETK